MRRTLAAALLGISLWIGSMAWSGFIMTSTILNPDRSQDIAESLLDDPDVRAQIVDNIADGVDDAVPAELPIARGTVEAGAEAALESDAVEGIFVRALVQAHRAFLGEADVPRSIDGPEFGGAARDSLVADRPELAGLVPEAPSLNIPLPTDRIPDAGPVRDFLLTAVPLMAMAAALGALAALVITTNRPAVIRRAGFWAMALSVFVLVFAYGIPAAAQRYAPDQAAIVAALVGAMAEATRGPAVALFVAGLVGLVVSMLWRPAAAVTTVPMRAEDPAPRRSRRRVTTAPPPTTRHPVAPGRPRSGSAAPPPTGMSRPTATQRPTAPQRSAGPGRVTTPRQATTPSVSDATAVHGAVSPPSSAHRSDSASTGRPVDPTRVGSTADPRTERGHAAPSPTNGAGERTRPGARFVDGVGWVHHGSDPIPADARWVPGVGYVLDR